MPSARTLSRWARCTRAKVREAHALLEVRPVACAVTGRGPLECRGGAGEIVRLECHQTKGIVDEGGSRVLFAKRARLHGDGLLQQRHAFVDLLLSRERLGKHRHRRRCFGMILAEPRHEDRKRLPGKALRLRVLASRRGNRAEGQQRVADLGMVAASQPAARSDVHDGWHNEERCLE